MEQAKIEKMDSLLKYVPFIDFLLSIDKQKYIKFTNIRKWIVLKGKNYPLSDLNKIEKSIITQYQNLLIEDKVRIPQNITTIFAPLKLQGYVNLCSDDDDDNDNDEGEQNKTNNKSVKVTKKNHCNKENEMNTKRNDCSRSTNKKIPCAMNNTKSSSTANDSDDDLEIISIDYIEAKGIRKFRRPRANISKDGCFQRR
ncbi:hypothetical protein DOY81_011340 [Sarcophaga bullata]|nr:hypothetical protein DOY81_011340 [Sarcophaga bullata]